LINYSVNYIANSIVQYVSTCINYTESYIYQNHNVLVDKRFSIYFTKQFTLNVTLVSCNYKLCIILVILFTQVLDLLIHSIKFVIRCIFAKNSRSLIKKQIISLYIVVYQLHFFSTSFTLTKFYHIPLVSLQFNEIQLVTLSRY